ncbi:MAG: hypothetical protein MUC59_04065, partial [Saprospiraceae bacterium]|nr:hypothetical protein [Saprospiraceae bacterium]
HSLQRHHYNFLIGKAGPQPQNSIMHSNVVVAIPVADAQNLGRNLQGKLRGNLRSNLGIEGDYRVNGRNYIVDSPNHFFVASGSSVWGGVNSKQWVAARNLRLIESDAISPQRIRKMVLSSTRIRLLQTGNYSPSDFEIRTPEVNSTAISIKEANSPLALAVVSGRSDLVAAFIELNRRDLS